MQALSLDNLARMADEMKEIRPDASSINTLQSTALAGSVDRVVEPLQQQLGDLISKLASFQGMTSTLYKRRTRSFSHKRVFEGVRLHTKLTNECVGII